MMNFEDEELIRKIEDLMFIASLFSYETKRYIDEKYSVFSFKKGDEEIVLLFVNGIVNYIKLNKYRKEDIREYEDYEKAIKKVIENLQ